jgi:Phospholipase_D-nuclease N-terminal
MFLVPLALAIYALVDCIQTDAAEVRNLPKFLWILLILLFWIVGPIAWLVAGRPRAETAGRGRSSRPTRRPGFPEHQPPPTLAPDDDPEFLSQLGRANADHEQMLKKWEDDLRRREEELRKEQGDGPDPDDRKS